MVASRASNVVATKFFGAAAISKLKRQAPLLLCACLGLSISAMAAEQRSVCNGSPGTASPTVNTIWLGNWTYLRATGWDDGTNFVRLTTDGPVGQVGMGLGGNPDFSVCWSQSPFTQENTDGGETCTNEGPFPFTTGQTYYRLNIDRSSDPTVYCQVAMVTAVSVPGIGDTFVVPLRADSPVVGGPSAIPVLPLTGLGLIAGVLGFLGLRRLRQ